MKIKTRAGNTSLATGIYQRLNPHLELAHDEYARALRVHRLIGEESAYLAVAFELTGRIERRSAMHAVCLPKTRRNEPTHALGGSVHRRKMERGLLRVGINGLQRALLVEEKLGGVQVVAIASPKHRGATTWIGLGFQERANDGSVTFACSVIQWCKPASQPSFIQRCPACCDHVAYGLVVWEEPTKKSEGLCVCHNVARACLQIFDSETDTVVYTWRACSTGRTIF
mmetsp:Transcript_67425/g.173624  ORF Transcript_67425/g.173624 Transcript_67425/m.173624 type:complete len:227 (+) Transcript_67425:1276-1956(+)